MKTMMGLLVLAVLVSGCKDDPKKPATAVPAATQQNKQESRWIYDKVSDAGDAEKTSVALNMSDRDAEGDRLNLVLMRKAREDVQVVLKTDKPVACPEADQTCFVRVRFDSGTSEKYSVEPAANEDKAVFVNRASTLVSMLKTAKTVWIDVPMEGKTATYALDIGGLDWNY